MSMVMPRRLDPNTTESLLAGSLHPEDAPPGYARLAALLGEAAHARAARDRGAALLADDEALGIVAAMRESLPTRQPAAPRLRTREQPPRGGPLSQARRTARIAGVPAALAGAGLLVMATAGAAVVVAATSPARQSVATSHATGQHVARAGSTHGDGVGHDASSTTHGGTRAEGDTRPGAGSATAGARSTTPNPHATFGLCTAEAAGAGAHRSPDAPALPSAATCAATRHPGDGYGRPSWSLPPGGAAYLPPSTAPGAHPGGPQGTHGGTPTRGAAPLSPGSGTRAPAGAGGS